MKELIPEEIIERKIFLLRGQKVMLSNHLAELYRVKVKVLIQAIKRNKERFPADFMYQLTWQEVTNLKSQFVISSSRSQIVTLKQGQNIKYLPYAFTEQGVAMLSGVLHSKRAVQVNITIMRAFVKLRQILLAHKKLAHKLEELERRIAKHDVEIQGVFEAIRQLMLPPEAPKRKIGFHTD